MERPKSMQRNLSERNSWAGRNCIPSSPHPIHSCSAPSTLKKPSRAKRTHHTNRQYTATRDNSPEMPTGDRYRIQPQILGDWGNTPSRLTFQSANHPATDQIDIPRLESRSLPISVSIGITKWPVSPFVVTFLNRCKPYSIAAVSDRIACTHRSTSKKCPAPPVARQRAATALPRTPPKHTHDFSMHILGFYSGPTPRLQRLTRARPKARTGDQAGG